MKVLGTDRWEIGRIELRQEIKERPAFGASAVHERWQSLVEAVRPTLVAVRSKERGRKRGANYSLELKLISKHDMHMPQ